MTFVFALVVELVCKNSGEAAISTELSDVIGKYRSKSVCENNDTKKFPKYISAANLALLYCFQFFISNSVAVAASHGFGHWIVLDGAVTDIMKALMAESLHKHPLSRAWAVACTSSIFRRRSHSSQQNLLLQDLFVLRSCAIIQRETPRTRDCLVLRHQLLLLP